MSILSHNRDQRAPLTVQTLRKKRQDYLEIRFYQPE